MQLNEPVSYFLKKTKKIKEKICQLKKCSYLCSVQINNEQNI